jgi:hypothetical protein
MGPFFSQAVMVSAIAQTSSGSQWVALVMNSFPVIDILV